MKPGILFALMSAALFGASTPFAKLLLGSVDPWLMAGLLYLGAGIGLRLSTCHAAPFTCPRSRRRCGVRICPGSPGHPAGGVRGPLLLMVGLARTDAAGTSLLLNLEGLATMGIAWVVFRENVDRRLLLGALAILPARCCCRGRGGASFSGARCRRRRLPRLGRSTTT